MLRWLTKHVWAGPVVAALCLAGYQVGRPVLWEDELISWDLARRGTADLFGTLVHQDAPYLAYGILLRAWVLVFGDSAVSLRMPSVLAMAGAAACVAVLGRRLFNADAGLVAGVLFALTPILTRYGQEARVYALVILAVCVSGLLLLRAADEPRRWGRWAAYALSVAAVGVLHAVALAVLAAHVVAVGLRASRDRLVLRSFSVAAAAALVLSAPLLVSAEGQSGSVVSWLGHPAGDALIRIWPQLFASSMLAGAVVAFGVAAWSRFERRRLEALAFATAWAVAPPLMVWLASQGSHSYFFYRYLLVSIPGWALLAGHGLSACGTGRAGPRTAMAGLAVLALLLVPDLTSVRGRFSHFWYPLDYPAAARQIAAGFHSGDAVVYGRAYQPWDLLDLGVGYYLPRNLHPRDVFLATSAAQNRSLSSPVECPDPAACLHDAARIWLVAPAAAGYPLRAVSPAQATLLRTDYLPVEERDLTGVTVTLLQRRR